jgi:uncharacterized membrane protein (UPF0127 family)
MTSVLIYNASKTTYITKNGAIAKTFIERLIGLMGKRAIDSDYALVIRPCNQVHMMFMRFTLDVVYLDRAGVVIDIDRSLNPWSFGKRRSKAKEVIEFKGNYIADKIDIGDVIVVEYAN